MVKETSFWLSVGFLLWVMGYYGFYKPNFPLENCVNVLCFNLKE